jgi:hypothetical protein
MLIPLQMINKFNVILIAIEYKYAFKMKFNRTIQKIYESKCARTEREL